MNFHTPDFLYFFAITYLGFLALRRTPARTLWLLCASYVFYAWWKPWYLLLIIFTTTLDYGCVVAMQKTGWRKFWVGVSVTNSLALLGFFKYQAFLLNNANSLLTALGSTWQIPLPQGLELPVGISFFTFQSMSYTIDCYRGTLQPAPNWIRFATFVAFFPQLVAGPIERASCLLPQLGEVRPITWRGWADGLSLFLVGYFKKVALADYLGAYVDPIYRVPDQHTSAALLLATFAFAWQIYFDFSGYTDMARGIASTMGYTLMLNFRHPYLATSLSDFWSRWHISLSSWFRDYVYIPLGGNRHGPSRTLVNLWLTMVISGLWHGANWTFLAWGALHGFAACLSRNAERSVWYQERVPKFLKQGIVFLFVCVTWVFFRAASVQDAVTILRRITAGTWTESGAPLLMIGLVLAVWVYQWISESRWQTYLESSVVRIPLAIAMLTYLWLFPGAAQQSFIYFQF